MPVTRLGMTGCVIARSVSDEAIQIEPQDWIASLPLAMTNILTLRCEPTKSASLEGRRPRRMSQHPSRPALARGHLRMRWIVRTMGFAKFSTHPTGRVKPG